MFQTGKNPRMGGGIEVNILMFEPGRRKNRKKRERKKNNPEKKVLVLIEGEK